MSREGTEVPVIAQQVDDVIVEPGALKLVVFEMLNASARNESFVSPGMSKFLKNEASYCRRMSDRSVFPFTLP